MVLAEGLAYQPIPFLEEAGEVQVRAAAREAPHVGHALSYPGDVRFVVLGVLPVGLYTDPDGRAPIPEGGLALLDTAHSPTLIPDVYGGVVRGGRLRVDQEALDHLIVQTTYILRLPVVSQAVWVVLIEGTLRHRRSEERRVG